MKTTRLITVLTGLIFIQTMYSQWIQTDGPYGSTSVSAIFENNENVFTGTNCGLHYTGNLKERWSFAAALDIHAFARKGDSLFFGEQYSGVMLLDLSQVYKAPVSMGLSGLELNTLSASDTCLFAGIKYGGFHKSSGFSDKWQSFNDGLPTDTMYIPRGGFYLVHYVNSIEIINNKIFCGTQEGVYRSDIDNFSWAESNNGIPAEHVHLLSVINDTLYAVIDNRIYYSHDTDETWNVFHTASSKVTSISKFNMCFYITTEGNGIFKSENHGSSWIGFNSGLTDLNVLTLTSIDSILVCGTSKEGFFYLDGNTWTKQIDGIICSRIRSITATSNAIIANDEESVYRYGNGNSWNDISPEVSYELFGSVASMNDTIFLSVEYDLPNWPYDAPFIVFSPDNGHTWENLINPVPFVRDDPYRLYCEDGNLYAYEDEMMYHTDDLGTTWTELSLPGQYCNGFNDFITYQGMEFAIACGWAQLLKLDPDNNWIFSNHGLPDNRDIKSLAKTTDALYAYVTGTGMYVSRDNGQNWSSATKGLEIDWWTWSFTYSDKNIFLSTDNGVFYSADHGQNWHSLNDGLINQEVRSIAIYHDTLYVGTLGNGIWKHDMASIPLSIPENKYESKQVRIYPNPASDLIYIDNLNIPSSRVQMIDLMGRQIINKKLDSNGILMLSGIPNGTYILTLSTGKDTFKSKLIIQK